MSDRTLTMAIGEPGSISRTTPAATPNTPITTLIQPKPLPKAGVPSMATPRAMTPMGRRRSPTTSNASNMPWVACHKRTSVACSSGGRPRSMIEVGDRGPCDLRKSSGREHAETHDAQRAPEQRGREARPPKSTIQGEKVDGPQGKDAQVQDLFHGVRRLDVGEPHDQPLGFGRIRAHEHAHDDEDGHERMPP